MSLVEADRPNRARPGADQHGTAYQPLQMRQQVPANPSLLTADANIGVVREGHVLDLLNAHYAHQFPGLLEAPEHNTIIELTLKFLPRHIGFCPAIGRDSSFISLRTVVSDGPNQLKIAIVTSANHELGNLPARRLPDVC